ncbi:MAG TPA: hypothetical protein VN428_16960 [Bryobacteraceae bacterium]|nr:hypothetical protein [Bryobacteraceae bacterium]
MATSALRAAEQAKDPHLVALMAENEYGRLTVVEADGANQDSVPGIEALKSADLLIVSVRSRTPRNDQMVIRRQYVAEHRPTAAIRTASHAFGHENPPAGHEAWPGFDCEALGGGYNNSQSDALLRGQESLRGVREPSLKERFAGKACQRPRKLLYLEVGRL